MKKKQNNRAGAVASPVAKNKKRLIIVLLSVFLGAVLIFGATFGIISAVRNAGYVALYGNIGIDEGVCNYLVSYYKSYYLRSLSSSGVEAHDTEEFWNTKTSVGSTYGEYLATGAKNYVAQLIAANIIFDEYTSLTEDERYEIELAIEDTLNYKASGSRSEFNKATKQYGFDFSDFEEATELLYKAWAVSDKVMGKNGENASRFSEQCLDFFAEYTNVHLLFVRTETTFVLDDEGNRVRDDNGDDMLRDLTEEERMQREERLFEIRDAVEKINSGDMVEERFFHFQNLYDEGDKSSHEYGYFFHPQSAFSREFGDAFPDLVEKAYDMRMGTVEEVETSVGPCFIYKVGTNTDLIKSYNEILGLDDFMSLAADDIFDGLVNSLVKEITFREKWSAIDFIKLPYNTDFVARY